MIQVREAHPGRTIGQPKTLGQKLRGSLGLPRIVINAAPAEISDYVYKPTRATARGSHSRREALNPFKA